MSLANGLNTDPPAGSAAGDPAAGDPAAGDPAAGDPAGIVAGAAACSARAPAQSSCGLTPSAWVGGCAAADCSASASAQSSAGLADEPAPVWPGVFVSVMIGSLVCIGIVGKQVLHAQRVLPVEDAVGAFHQRHAVDAGDHGLGH